MTPISARTMVLRPARLDELAALSDIAFRSKAHWGYDAAFMEACRAELTLSPADLDDATYHLAEHAGAPIGFCGLGGPEAPDGRVCELHSLFVAPEAMGRGAGKCLMLWALQEARRRGAQVLRIEADPFAEAFYTHMGAVCVGRVPSASIAGRSLPLMDYALD